MNNPGAEAASDQQVTSQLVVASTSRAADGGYLALRDLSEIADAMGVEYRVVGGHMVTLLATLHGVSDQVPLRETTDADLGVSPQVVADPRLPQALRDRNYALSGAANRFVRDRDGGRGRLEVVIDVLAPSYRGGLRPNQRHGDLFVDEIPGLAFALSVPLPRLSSGCICSTATRLRCISPYQISRARCVSRRWPTVAGSRTRMPLICGG